MKSDGGYQPKPKIGRPNRRGAGSGSGGAKRALRSCCGSRTIFFLGLALATGAGSAAIGLGDASTVDGACGTGAAVSGIAGDTEPRSSSSLGAAAGNAIVSGTNGTGRDAMSVAAGRVCLAGVRAGGAGLATAGAGVAAAAGAAAGAGAGACAIGGCAVGVDA